jgi:hypothetical protein
MEPSRQHLLAKAAELQRLVRGAVLVGDVAAALHAGHRRSFDHDHVIADLAERFDTVLDNLEALADWSMARARPGKLILGSLGDIETGIRQLIRGRPLEVEQVEIDGNPLVVPTIEEMLRITCWLAVTRNQTRDYLDIAALSDRLGTAGAASVIAGIDPYYDDVNAGPEAVVTQVVRQLADPRPRDQRTTTELSTYKGLEARWHDWDEVRRTLRAVAEAVIS